MVQFIDRKPSFAEKFGMGLNQALPAISDLISQREKQNLIKSILNPQSAAPPAALPFTEQQKEELFRNLAMQTEQQTGEDLQPAQLDQMWQKLQMNNQPQQPLTQPQGISQEQLLAASQVDPNLARVLQGIYESEQKERLQGRKEEFAREKQAEPKLLETEEKLRGLEQSGMRFERLNELFSPELEEKFPSSFLVGAFSKDGELRPSAAALLSPEAQEAVKLVSDELSGAKDTFGARVTNFDLQAYMKRLPTLLNSPEGRRRVLRDLRLMNQLNQMHHEGILDIVDKHGGPGKISLSKAERIFRSENASKIKDLREEFVNPNKKQFSSMPSASNYRDRILVDDETGQKFRSNGREWIPE